ncbi:MAG: hypothetical protein UV38_C0002G0296 [candidate division TM6 bacterium GW2011_GWE2_42_60]|nr:MAG: hypothetical protein UV38_C0002G0296 [candidate division TM6 bacterium GW2011_GWE2_42_60]HBY05952.1 hypothetical protein [Candidatus Dependentiae bacterium]
MINCTKKFLTALSLAFVVYFTTLCMEAENPFVKAAKACNVPDMDAHLKVMPQKDTLVGLATPIFEALNNRLSMEHIPEEQIATAVAYLLGDTVTIGNSKYTIPQPSDTPKTTYYEASHKRNSDGKLPLHIAATYGHNAAIAHLLKNGNANDIYSVDNYKSIPLTYAIAGRIESTALLLLNKMTDINEIQPTSIRQLLENAIKSQSQKIIDIIFDNNNIFAQYIKQNYAKFADTIDLLPPLALAIEENQNKAIDWILSVGGAALKERLKKLGSEDISILPLACSKSTVTTVKKLIAAGCDINTCNTEGSPLSAAAYAGKLDVVSYLLSIKTVDVNQLCTDFSPLISAVGVRPGVGLSQELVKNLVFKLLSAGADINQAGKSPDGYNPAPHSPLYVALANGWFKAAVILKNRGAKFTNEEQKTSPPGGHENLVNQILSEKKEESPEIIQEASIDNDQNNLISSQWLSVKKQIEKKKQLALAYNKFGWTLLHEAAKQSIPSAETTRGNNFIHYMATGISKDSTQPSPLNDEQEYLREYLRSEFDFLTSKKLPLPLVDYFGGDLEKTLDYLAQQSYLQEGIDRGMDIKILFKQIEENLKKPKPGKANRPNEEKATEHLNSISAKTMIPFIIEQGLPVNIIDFDGRTALHIAAIYDQTGEAIKALLDKNASLLAQDFNNATAFHLAAQNNNTISINALFENPQKEPFKNYNKTVDALNKTALHEAALSNAFTIIPLLIDHGWDINATDSNGNTPLHLAANKGNVEAVTELINKGADTTKKNNAGKTAAHLAADKEPRIGEVSANIRGMGFTFIEGQKGNPAKCFALLIEKNPLLATEKDSTNKTPIHYIYSHNNKEAKDAFLAKKPSLDLYKALIENDLVDAFTDLAKKYKLPKELDPKDVKKDWAIIAIQEIRNPQPKIEKAIEEKKEEPKTNKDVFVDLAKAFAQI